MRRLIRNDTRPSVVAGRGWPLVPPRPIRWLIFLGLTTATIVWALGHQKTSLDRRPGNVVPNFELVDARTGQVNRLVDYQGRVLVVVFVGTSCPVGDLYMPRLVELSKKYEPRNVDFLAINSNESDSIEDVAEYGRRSRVAFPILKDLENRVADRLLAERTCEALVIDGRGRLRYRGAIDDQYGLGSRRDQPVNHYLTSAIDEVLAGRNVSTAMTQVVGCPIERKTPPRAVRSLSRRASPAASATTVTEAASRSPSVSNDKTHTFDEVAPILHARCASCHRPGQVAPFSLLTYDQAHRWSASIAEVIADNRMPPWHADPRYGHFANDRSLTPHERSVLTAWISQGAERGDQRVAPEPPKYPQGWSIGTPDLVYEMPETFLVQAEGTVPIKHFRLMTTHTEDLYIQAAEARPGDRAVVHHICIYIDDHKKKKTDVTRNKNLLVAYTPGDMPSVYSPGIAKKIPPGTELVFEVHYTPIGQVRFDRTSVGVIFAKEPPRHLAVTRGIAGWGLTIPPGVADHVQRAGWTVPTDSHLLSMTPHMHLRGKSFMFVAHTPDGRDETLLSVPNYDFNWQSVYRLAEPKALPRGTTLHCEAHFDNSAANPANPDPGQIVHWGEQTDDEMMIGFIDYYEDAPIPAGTMATQRGR
jgi:thiol-disulfide isomerase/thioredoxin